jgi:hypothetical protein
MRKSAGSCSETRSAGPRSLRGPAAGLGSNRKLVSHAEARASGVMSLLLNPPGRMSEGNERHAGLGFSYSHPGYAREGD